MGIEKSIQQEEASRALKTYLDTGVLVDEFRSNLGLNHLQTYIIIYLGQYSDRSSDKGVPRSEFNEKLNAQNISEISRGISTLEDRGYTGRKIDREKLTKRYIHLTPKGWELYDRLEHFLESKYLSESQQNI